MNLADELRKLHDLHRSGALSEEEYATAKAKVLAGSSSSSAADSALKEQLDEIRLDNDVARLDREWELQRQNYMIAGKYGQRHIPTRGSSLLGGAIIVIFGIFWTIMAFTMTQGFGGVGTIFPLFGVLFIFVGVGVSLYSFTKAGQYEEAYQRYRQRRAQLLGGNPHTQAHPEPPLDRAPDSHSIYNPDNH